MLESLRFVNHLNEEVVFNKGGYIADIKALKNYAWQYNTQYKKISSFERKITKFKLPLLVYGTKAGDMANLLYETIEKDVLANVSGKLYVGDYYISGYFTESSKRKYSSDRTAISMELTFVSDAPYWVYERKYTYRTEGKGQGGNGYPYDYPYGYIANSDMQNLVNPSFTDANFKLVIYGAVDNPQIVIGGNVYKVNTSIYTNEYLTIDAKNKTVTRTTSRGLKVNEFSNRDRENYVFQKIAPGDNLVIPVTDCPFDLTLYEERSEPKWT